MFGRSKVTPREQITEDYSRNGAVVVGIAKCTVVISTYGLSMSQFRRVEYVLGETFGSMMVNRISDDSLEISWYSDMTPAKLTECALDALRRNGVSIGAAIGHR